MVPVVPAGAASATASPRPPPPAGDRSFGAVLERSSTRLPGPAGPRAPQHLTLAPPERAPERTPCTQLLEVVDRARARLDGVLATVRSGRTFTAQELLGLQAEAYRTVQTVDLGVKLAEQGAQAVRQTLATQV